MRKIKKEKEDIDHDTEKEYTSILRLTVLEKIIELINDYDSKNTNYKINIDFDTLERSIRIKKKVTIKC